MNKIILHLAIIIPCRSNIFTATLQVMILRSEYLRKQSSMVNHRFPFMGDTCIIILLRIK